MAEEEQNGIIEDIKETENLVLLIRKPEYAKNWQHPYEITDYVIENYEQVGEVLYFDIYEEK